MPFRTKLEPNAPLNGLYDPELVKEALSYVSFRLAPKSDRTGAAKMAAEFVRRCGPELHVFSDFIRSSYSNKIKRLSQLTPVEVSNILYIFRDMYHKGKIPGIDADNVAAYDSMVTSFLAFLAADSNPAVPVIVSTMLDRSRPFYADLYSNGIGNLLPELRVLTSEFDFTTLTSVRPVLHKISILVSELSSFLEEHDESHEYDSEFFRVVIHVLRYKKLQDILETADEENISPSDLLALTRDPEAIAIQSRISKLSGEPEKLDDLVFVRYRNFLNAIYSSVGLLLFGVVFARLYQEVRRLDYSEAEKAAIDNFVATFLPLVCGGLLPIDALLKLKYSCLPAKHNGRVLAPFKISGNIFQNYDFSLAMLYDVPSYFHVLRAAQLDKRFSNCSIDEISLAVLSATNCSLLLREDARTLIDALRQMEPYCILGFSILDELANHPSLLRVAQTYDSHQVHVANLLPEIVDLTSSLTTDKVPANSSVRVNNLELADFKNELAAFRKHDLGNVPYSYLSDKAILRFIGSRINDVVSKDIVRDGSAVTPATVDQYSNLLHLLSASFDINKGNTTMLDDLVSDVAEQGTKKPEYFQIPEHIKIHNFCPELEILKTDELGSSFKSFTPEDILSLLNKRITEISQSDSTTTSSRMTPKNLSRFMKLSANLKQLFNINNGDTEVLDAVLRSQSVLQQLETKLAEKQKQSKHKEQQISNKANLYAPGPYVQIPDNLQLHEFVEELKIFRHDDLRSSYKNFPAEKVLSLMQKRIKEIYNDLPSTNLALRMSKKNLVAFIKLHAKLEKLLAWNGGNTGILDTIIYSQSVFDDFESKLASKKKSTNAAASQEKVYKQIPDDVFLEEFAEELLAIKKDLGKEFRSSTKQEILRSLFQVCNSQESTEAKVIYGKLALNLAMLFKHNHDETFVLDNVLLNAKAFDKFEQGLSQRSVANDKVNVSDQKIKESPVEYHTEDYVLSLLNTNNTPVDLDPRLVESEASITEAIKQFRSKEESKLLNVDPDEYAALESLSPETIRMSYGKKQTREKQVNGKQEPTGKKQVNGKQEPSVKKQATGKQKASRENQVDHKKDNSVKSKPSKAQAINRDSLEKLLKNSKKESDHKAEERWRAQKAYEWSYSMCKSSRTLETGNFFDPMFGSRSRKFPMFPSTEVPMEYLVLTSNGQTFLSKENPLGAGRTAEDMLAILGKYDENQLQKFQKGVNKLQKEHWKLIGGVANEKMLVFSRRRRNGKKKFLTKVKNILASTGVVFLTLVGLNIWLDDGHQVAFPEAEDDKKVESEQANADDWTGKEVEPFVSCVPEDISESTDAPPTLELSSQPSSLWKRLLWRE